MLLPSSKSPIAREKFDAVVRPAMSYAAVSAENSWSREKSRDTQTPMCVVAGGESVNKLITYRTDDCPPRDARGGLAIGMQAAAPKSATARTNARLTRARDRIEHSVMYYASLSRAQLGLRVRPAGHVRVGRTYDAIRRGTSPR